MIGDYPRRTGHTFPQNIRYYKKVYFQVMKATETLWWQLRAIDISIQKTASVDAVFTILLIRFLLPLLFLSSLLEFVRSQFLQILDHLLILRELLR